MMSRHAFRFCAALAALSSVQAQAAQANQCLSHSELHGLVAYVLPTVTDMVVDRCKSRVPADSFINTRGPQLVNGLRQGQSAAWPMARAAFGKLAGQENPEAAQLMATLPESTGGPIIESFVEDELSDSIKTKDCQDIDRILGTMAPMQPADFVNLATEILVIGAREDKKLSVCQAS